MSTEPDDDGEIAAVGYGGNVYFAAGYVRTIQRELENAKFDLAAARARIAEMGSTISHFPKEQTMFNATLTLTGGADEDSHASRDVLLSGKGLEEAQVVALQQALHRVEGRLIAIGEAKANGTLEGEPASSERQDLKLTLNVTRDGARFFRVGFEWAQAPQEVADLIKASVKEEAVSIDGLRNPGK